MEAIKDPLTHIVRNSVDHGIETAEIRTAAGKPAEGTLLLRAFHQGGQVNIEIIDDGAGINVERVRDKAIDKGFVTLDKAESMSDRDLTNLILLPGFSTAEKVTNVSGRGVGMDVVRTNIEKIGGSLELQSAAGQGTTLRIKIPLTLAIVPALIVDSSGQQFAIPQVSLVELVRLDADRAEHEIEMIHDVPVFRLRGHLLPLMYLDEQLQLQPKPLTVEADETADIASDEHEIEKKCVNVVVLQAEDRQFGLIVDAISDTQEIVVKPLGKQLGSVPSFAGATIMGDGTVALILDVSGLAQLGGILTEHHDRGISEDQQQAKQDSSSNRSMLIADRGDGIRVAFDLSSVARLEEFAIGRIEQTDIGAVVQYRDGILPLVAMIPDYRWPQPGEPKSGSSASDLDSEKLIQVIVFSKDGGSQGVVVGEIIDIVEQSSESLASTTEAGGELIVIQEKVTRVVSMENNAGPSATINPTCN